MTKVFHYHRSTGEYIATATAHRDPVDKTPLVPGHATLIAPPDEAEGKARVFRNGAWSLVDDHRGATYWTADGAEHTMDDLGPLPNGALDSLPPPTLDERKAAAIAEAQGIAAGIRRTIAKNVPLERALAWVNKVPYALIWAAHEAGGDPAGPLAAIAAEAEAGFQIEADVSGTTAVERRDRTIAKNATFFRATQLVEGMEGLAETTIPAAADDAALDAAIAHLQSLQAQAMQQLDAIIKGGS